MDGACLKTADDEFVLAVENVNAFSVELSADLQKCYRETRISAKWVQSTIALKW